MSEHFLGGRMFSCCMGLEDSFQPGNLSGETVQYDNRSIPAVTKICSVTVAGIE